MKKRNKFILFATIIGLLVGSALLWWNTKEHSQSNLAKTVIEEPDTWDLYDIQESGELIAATISGPETYYQYRGVDMGLQYLLAERYANASGVRIRMELASDTVTLEEMLRNRDIDVICLDLSQENIVDPFYIIEGTGWAVRKTCPLLAQNLQEWYCDSILSDVKEQISLLKSMPRLKTSSPTPLVYTKKGQISPYDGLFVKYSRTIGWDWRLLAALGGVESAYDPKAVSYVGARGLMQVMPRTGASLGVSAEQLFEPEHNISTGTKYIKKLQREFSDIKDPAERTKFVLAAYNGGVNHVRDAMKLAEKYKRSSQRWADVSYFVLHLSEPKYYRDPVVKYGYMIGQETYNYVHLIYARWNKYRGIITKTPLPTGSPAEPSQTPTHKRNRFTAGNQGVISREDSIFRLP